MKFLHNLQKVPVKIKVQLENKIKLCMQDNILMTNMKIIVIIILPNKRKEPSPFFRKIIKNHTGIKDLNKIHKN